MTLLLIAIAAFSSAFLGCLQAINVVRGHRVMAAFTSVAIGGCQLTLYKLVPHVDSIWQGLAFICAGLAGAQSSMLFKAWHERRNTLTLNSVPETQHRPLHEIEYDLEQAEERLEATSDQVEFGRISGEIENLRDELESHPEHE